MGTSYMTWGWKDTSGSIVCQHVCQAQSPVQSQNTVENASCSKFYCSRLDGSGTQACSCFLLLLCMLGQVAQHSLLPFTNRNCIAGISLGLCRSVYPCIFAVDLFQLNRNYTVDGAFESPPPQYHQTAKVCCPQQPSWGWSEPWAWACSGLTGQSHIVLESTVAHSLCLPACRPCRPAQSQVILKASELLRTACVLRLHAHEHNVLAFRQSMVLSML